MPSLEILLDIYLVCQKNIETDRVNTVVFNLHQIKPVIVNKMLVMEPSIIIYKKELVK